MFGRDFKARREKLVDRLVRYGYLTKGDVISAMKKVPREHFVPERIRDLAYQDSPLQIGEGQTISAPHMVAIMVERLDLEKGHKVLEIGGGFGYHAAVVTEVIGEEGHVFTVERIESLARRAKENLRNAGYEGRVTVVLGDGSKGLAEHAPYDRIFVACAAPDIPKPLIEQLKDGGKILVPVGNKWFQSLIFAEKRGGKVKKRDYGGCVFVPLIGEYGFEG